MQQNGIDPNSSEGLVFRDLVGGVANDVASSGDPGSIDQYSLALSRMPLSEKLKLAPMSDQDIWGKVNKDLTIPQQIAMHGQLAANNPGLPAANDDLLRQMLSIYYGKSGMGSYPNFGGGSSSSNSLFGGLFG
jgi:hypothetical protein